MKVVKNTAMWKVKNTILKITIMRTLIKVMKNIVRPNSRKNRRPKKQ